MVCPATANRTGGKFQAPPAPDNYYNPAVASLVPRGWEFCREGGISSGLPSPSVEVSHQDLRVDTGLTEQDKLSGLNQDNPRHTWRFQSSSGTKNYFFHLGRGWLGFC